MSRSSFTPSPLAFVALLALASLLGVPSASAQSCDPVTGSPPAEPILGPDGEQFFPENESCPDRRFVAPICKGGSTLTWVDPTDPNALRRYACVSSPAGATDLPLVVFLHGSRIRTVDVVFGGARFGKPKTQLQAFQESADLGGDSPGYVLLMPQGRCLEAPPSSTGSGVRFDTWHKDKDANLDVRAIRAFIQQLEDRSTFDESGNAVALPASIATVDEKRTYLMDWSNGGYMSHFMALSFPEEFAAVGSFASADPFSRRPCATPFPAGLSRKPGMIHVHASCDPILPCKTVGSWRDRLSVNGWSRNDNVDVITDSTKEQEVDRCMSRLEARRAGGCSARGHTTYADAQLPRVFEFLKGYELP